MNVSDLMNSNVISIAPDETAATAARLLTRHDVGSLPVCSADGKLRGILTDRDIVLRCVAAECDPQTTTVREIMTRGVSTAAPEEDIRAASHIMARGRIRRLPVVSGDGKVVGMLSLGDLAKNHSYDMEASKALSEICQNIRRC